MSITISITTATSYMLWHKCIIYPSSHQGSNRKYSVSPLSFKAYTKIITCLQWLQNSKIAWPFVHLCLNSQSYFKQSLCWKNVGNVWDFLKTTLLSSYFIKVYCLVQNFKYCTTLIWQRYCQTVFKYCRHKSMKTIFSGSTYIFY